MWCVIVNDISTEIWHKALLLCKDEPEWCGVSHLALVIEICLCTPCSNAMLERFFNHLKVVKTDQRTSLSSSSLNSILPIQLWQIPITHFMKNLLTKLRPIGTMTNSGDWSKRRESHTTKGNHRRSHAKNLTLPNLFSMIPAQMIMMTLVLQIVVMMM